MKRTFLTSIIYLLGLACASCQDKSQLQVTLFVTDEEAAPLDWAKVSTHVFDTSKPTKSGGFGEEVYERAVVVTGKDGNAILNVWTSRAELNLIGSKNGYYDGSAGYHSKLRVEDRWQPWNPTIQVILKRVRKPIPLIAKKVVQGFGDYIPVPADKAAYDLEVGDWVAPHGTGKIGDLVFELQGKTDRPGEDYQTTLTLSFSNPKDGLVFVQRPKDYGSAMKMPYLAPDVGYLPQKSWRKHLVNPQVIKGGYIEGKIIDETKPNEDYFFRLRTKTDEKGNIVSAHYAKVQGSFLWWPTGLIQFQYYFNPTPNDRNLEFDVNRNLLKVEDPQRVIEP